MPSRLHSFEKAFQACIAAEIKYDKNPLDAGNLIAWGSALLELSTFENVQESKPRIKDAISKLEEALLINPKECEALCLLGKANCTYAFLTADPDEANVFFGKASQYVQQAVDEDPENELYKESLLVAARAPEYHLAVHKQIFAQQVMMDPVPSTSSSAKVESSKPKPKPKKTFGWFICAVGIVALAGFAISQVTPRPVQRRQEFRERGSKLQYSVKLF